MPVARRHGPQRAADHDPSPPPATPAEKYALDPTSLLAGLHAGPSLLASLVVHEVLGPPVALRPRGESPHGAW